jgi:hypothetical protein
MSTSLTVHLSAAFLQEITGTVDGSGVGSGTQGGTWAYLWNEQPPPDVTASPLLPAGAAANFTPLILNGALSSNVTFNSANNDYEVVVSLTDSSLGAASSSSAYLIVQSEDPSNHTDLTQSTAIGGTIGNIAPNAQAWNYGYAAFEFNLQNKSADQGDLTAIPGFAQHLAVNIDYDNATNQSRGYALTGQALISALSTGHTNAELTYPTSTTGTPFSPLDGQVSMLNSPSNATFGPAAYPTSAWGPYVGNVSSLNDMVLSGLTNGEADANGIWHNGQYYSYTVSTESLSGGTGGATGGAYFVLSPNADSQTQGYILINQATLQSNLYAAGQGTMSIWQDSDFTMPYAVPGSAPFGSPETNVIGLSANNQWGNLLTPFFTGFTAGYWGTTVSSPNTMMPMTASPTNLGGGTINLDQTLSWSSTYAFDNHRVGAPPTYQHYDPYTKEFFYDSNVYGSAFSDNISSGITPGPLIALSQPDGAKLNVSNIDLYVYGSQETDTQYTAPVGAIYLPLTGTQHDYLPITPATAASNGPELVVSGQTAGLFPASDLTVQLGIYQGGGQFIYVPLPPSQNSNTGEVDYWQNYNVSTNSGTSWSISSGGPNLEGTFIINGLPTFNGAASGQVYWYQLVFSDSQGDQKVYNFYSESGGTAGPILTASGDFAADGGATLAPVAGQPTQMELTLNPASSMPFGMLTFDYNSQFASMPAAPVVGTLGDSGFTSFAGQSGMGIMGTGAPSIIIGTGSELAFGWTGTNSYAGANPVPTSTGYTAGWTTAYTNKINAGNIAEISLVDTSDQQPLNLVAHATADFDGQWNTGGSTQLGNGTFTVTMQEYLPDGTTVFGSGSSAPAPVSAQLALTVNISQLTLEATQAGNGLEFAPHAALGTGGGNWLHFDPLPTSHLAQQGSEILMYATLPDGTLVARDGETGPDITIGDATLGRIGSLLSDGGTDLIKLSQAFFLPDNEQLHFAVLGSDGKTDTNPDIHVTAQSDGSLVVKVGSMALSATDNNNITHQTYLASEQHSTDTPLVYLFKGETLHFDVAGSANNANTLHFVHFDVDPNTGAASVGGVAYGNTDAFRAAVQKNWDQGITVQDGHGTFQDTGNWTVAGKSGFYAPVLATQNGDIFVVGTANVDGREHIKVFGENTFGFEDLRADQHSDFDYNDMVVKLTDTNWLVH